MSYQEKFMEHAFELALESEKAGNLPIGAVITDGEKILAEGRNGVMSPFFHPGRHAELDALNNLEEKDIKRLDSLSMYVTLEPCIMCLGSAILHRVKTIFFATVDPDRGANYLVSNIRVRYPEKHLPLLQGPMAEERGQKLFERAKSIYRAVRPSV